jgi:hypothetical protein
VTRSLPTRARTPSIARAVSGYGRERQLGPYAMLFATYATATGLGVLTGVRRRGVPRPTLTDGALLAVAAFKLSRLVTKDKVTGFVRAPFTEFVEEGDGAEVNEAPRGDGLRHAIGELLTCPFCFNQWAATGLAVAWLHAPRATRDVNALLAASAAADVLHVAWTKLESQA